MLNSSETTTGLLDIRFLIKYVSVFLQKSPTRFFQHPFVQNFAAELYFVFALIEASISFIAQTNHFSATKLLLKQTMFSYIMFDVSLATSSREKIAGSIRREIVAAVIFSYSVPCFFQFCFYTNLKRIICEH